MSNTADTCYNFIKSIGKIALHSRKGVPFRGIHHDTVIVMGNGPSLADVIENKLDILKKHDTIAVNFAALSDALFDIKPGYYVLAAPHFCSTGMPGDNLDLLQKAFDRIDWLMTLFVPNGVDASRYKRPGITIRKFNAVGIEGPTGFTHAAFCRGLGMPRPRNVLIPAIMLAIAEGYKRIIIVGADHSWMKTISVTDENEVVSIQPHFYTETNSETERIRHDYRSRKLHDVVESFAVAFRSYHEIASYARALGIEIFNATPGSFIDAFERCRL
ncbi:MAG: hypothetical protein K2L75_06250 [Muribaculaceae bacterium]|nr:hypothetical protein [Muribaculaceae bacterium]